MGYEKPASAPATAPLPEEIQVALRDLIRRDGVQATCTTLGVPRNALLQGAAGGDVHPCSAIVLTQRVRSTPKGNGSR
jgi:hypothetical protein